MRSAPARSGLAIFLLPVLAVVLLGLGAAALGFALGQSLAEAAAPDAPGAVTNLTATPGYHRGRDTFNVKAAWSAPSTAPTGKYKVELLQGSRLWEVKRPAAAATEAGFRSLNPGGSYKIRVTAYNQNSDGETAGTAVEKTFTALSRPAAPGAVTDLELTPRPGTISGRYEVFIEWKAPETVPTGRYLVQLFQGTHPFATRQNAPGPGADRSRFANLRPGTQYTVKVTPHNQGDGTTTAGRTAGPTATGTITVPPLTAPGAVTGLSVKIRDDAVATWTAPDPAPTGGYHIKWDHGPGTDVLQESWSKKNRASLIIYEEARSYRVSVTAHNENVLGRKAGPTAKATATKEPPSPPPSPPGTVTGLTLSQTEDGEILIVSWTPPNPAPTGRYLVELFEGTDDSTPAVLWKRLKGNATTKTRFVAAGGPGSTYTVSIKSRNRTDDGGNSAWSTTVTKTKTMQAPPAPGAVTGLSISKITKHALTVTWTAPNPAPTGKYWVEVYVGNDTSGTRLGLITVGPKKELKVRWVGLKRGTTYTVSVKAHNKIKESRHPDAPKGPPTYFTVAGPARTLTGTTE